MAESPQIAERFVRQCPAGTVVFREGETGDNIFVVRSGRVRITKLIGEHRVPVAELGPGEFFGEMAVLNGKPRTGTAEVIEEAALLVIDAKTFETMVTANSEVAVRLIQKLARRLDAANALIEVFMQTDPRARVILGLSRLVDLEGTLQPDGTVRIDTTPKALAAQLNMPLEAVQSVVRRLERLRMLTAHGNALVVSDSTRLREFLEFLEAREKTETGHGT